MSEDKSKAPVLRVKIPLLQLTAGSPISSLNLRDYIASPDSYLRFATESQLPTGLELTPFGRLQGTPALSCARKKPYSMMITVSNRSLETLDLYIDISVFETMNEGTTLLSEFYVRDDDFTAEKAEVWHALLEDLPLPTMEEISSRPILASDLDYIYKQFGTFMVWNVDGSNLADNGRLISVKGVSEHFDVYDFDRCLIATPKELFSTKRTFMDSVVTAKAVARLAHQRQWHVELGGYHRLVDAAFGEINTLNHSSGHQMEIRNYGPS